jgi:outer membrane protein
MTYRLLECGVAISRKFRFMQKILLPLLLILSCASANCLAQVPAANSMPDGSKDMYVGAVLDVMPTYEGSGQLDERLRPGFQVEWSNGVFVSASQLGMHLSQTPGIEYGPLMTLSLSRPEYLSPNTAVLGDWMTSIGGFFKYDLGENLQLSTDLMYNVGQFRGGAFGNLDLRKYTDIAAHHSLSLWAGLTWVNRDYAEAQFGVTGQQSAVSGFPIYSPGAGVSDVHAGINWHWSLSSSWMLNSGLYASRLTGSVANSPTISGPFNVTVFSGFAYRF